MRDNEKVFQMMKEEIERQAKNEEQDILDEVEQMETSAYASLKEEAKRDIDLRLLQSLDSMKEKAASEISKSHMEKKEKLITQRDEYVENIFKEVKKRLIDYSHSSEYVEAMVKKINRSMEQLNDHSYIIYISANDTALLTRIQQDFSTIKIKNDSNIQIGGFIMQNHDGSLVVDEVLDTILENQRDWFNKNSGLVIQ